MKKKITQKKQLSRKKNMKGGAAADKEAMRAARIRRFGQTPDKAKDGAKKTVGESAAPTPTKSPPGPAKAAMPPMSAKAPPALPPGALPAADPDESVRQETEAGEGADAGAETGAGAGEGEGADAGPDQKQAETRSGANTNRNNNGKGKKSTINLIFNTLLEKRILEETHISINIFRKFLLLGLVSAWLFSMFSIHDKQNGLYGPASIVIWSYGTAIVSLLFILLLNNLLNKNFSAPSFNGNTISGFLTIFLITWLISINLKHFKKINMNAIPEKYSNYSHWTALLILIQSFFIFLSYGDNSADEEKSFINKIVSLNYIIIFLTFILVLIQQLILDNFSVDVL